MPMEKPKKYKIVISKALHFFCFGESLRLVQERLDSKNFYAFNPEFDVLDRKPSVQECKKDCGC